MSETCIRQQLRIPLELAGLRLDQAAAQLFPDHSRARLQGWISDGQLTVNQRRMRPRDRVVGGEELSLDAVLEAQGDWQAQPIDFRVLFEDDDLLVIDKPAGLVVHPAAGNWEGTLLNGLLHRIPQLIQLPRAGIVHRLDKETSGLMVVAKSLRAHTSLVGQLQNRSMGRDYEAVAEGAMIAGGTVDRPIGRHPRQRTRMAVVATGKPAVTHYRLLHRFRHYSHLRLSLETGRTHQIRVHMAELHHPLVGDRDYGGRLRLPAGLAPALIEVIRAFPRQALHAKALRLTHPHSGETLQWEVPLPADMQQLLEQLAQHDAA